MQGDLKFRDSFTFWISAKKDQDQELQYKELLQKVGSFSSAEEFWSFYQYIQRPEKLPEGTQILLFHHKI